MKYFFVYKMKGKLGFGKLLLQILTNTSKLFYLCELRPQSQRESIVIHVNGFPIRFALGYVNSLLERPE